MSKARGITLAVLAVGLVMALGLFLTWIGSGPLEPVAPTGRQIDQAEAHRSGEEAVVRDIPILLDDWIDGTGETPDEVFDRLLGGGSAMEDMGSDGSEGVASMDGMHEADAGPAGASHDRTMTESEEDTESFIENG